MSECWSKMLPEDWLNKHSKGLNVDPGHKYFLKIHFQPAHKYSLVIETILTSLFLNFVDYRHTLTGHFNRIKTLQALYIHAIIQIANHVAEVQWIQSGRYRS